MRTIEEEIASQPDVWCQAAALAREVAALLPRRGERLAILGCGTSYFVGQALAALRERAGHGETDAFPASEVPAARRYDSVLAVSRSGTTTEVVRALELVPDGVPTVAICAVPDTEVATTAGHSVILDFADELAIVQTRFPTAVLALMRALTVDGIAEGRAAPLPDGAEEARAAPLPDGAEDSRAAPPLDGIDAVAREGEEALAAPLPDDLERFDHFVFLSSGWGVGLASEAALKMREVAGAWSEAYPAMEYRHGPISATRPTTLVWALGAVERSVLESAAAAGATIVDSGRDPMAELIVVQRAAVELARWRGLDPNRPRHLSRSVVLDGERSRGRA